MRTGGQMIVEALEANGATHVFCVPGESYLAVLDALHDASIELIVCRQEAGATIMAEAEGKLTGRPGIAFVTRGPGAILRLSATRSSRLARSSWFFSGFPGVTIHHS